MFFKKQHFFAYLMLGIMIFNTTSGMEENRNQNRKRCPNILRYLNPMNALRRFVRQRITREINNDINSQNFQPMVDQTVHAIINSLNNQQNAQALVQAVGTLFNSSAQVMQQQFGQDGNGSQAMQAFLNAIMSNLGNLWQNDQKDNQGAGRQALNQFLNMMRDSLHENGETANFIREFLNRSFTEANREFGNNLNDTFRLINNNLETNVRNTFVQANQEIDTGLRNLTGNISNSFNNNIGFDSPNGILNRLRRGGRHTLIEYGGIAALSTLGIATAFFGVKWFWGTYMKWWFKKPQVIIDSSKKRSVWSRIFGSKVDHPKMVFAPQLQQRLERLVQTTKNITKKIKENKKNIKYRNLLLWGPPGTGKTMFAKQLAEKSGMEWVMVTGSSFFQKNAGIKSIDELFRWAQKSSKGLLIFIDEADSLLPDRTKLQAGTQNYQIVNHFLNYLGERSQKFMVVMSTNHKTAFDSAMQRRIDDLIHMPLPGQAERAGVLQLYRNRELLNTKYNSTEFIDSVHKHLDDNAINSIAKRTNGLSNGDLSGIINTILTEADDVITPAIIELAVERALQKHKDFNPRAARRHVRAA